MLRQHYRITIILFSILIICTTTTTAELIDKDTYWLMVDTSEGERASAKLQSLSKLLVDVGKVPKYRIQHLKGEDASSDGIRNTLIEIGNNPASIETIVFLLSWRCIKTPWQYFNASLHIL